jgi:hypothetical protein
MVQAFRKKRGEDQGCIAQILKGHNCHEHGLHHAFATALSQGGTAQEEDRHLIRSGGVMWARKRPFRRLIAGFGRPCFWQVVG